MAGDMPDLNTDSFVDTIANTVGVLIVLVVVSIAMYGIRAIEVDPDLGKKHRDTVDNEKDIIEKDSQIALLEREVEDLEQDHAEDVTALEDAQQELESANSSLEGKREEFATATGRLDEVKSRKKGISANIANLRKDEEKASKGLDADDLSDLQFAADDLEGQVAAIDEKTKLLTSQRDVAEDEAKRAKARIVTLKVDKDDLASRVVELEEEKGITTIVIRNPLKPLNRRLRTLRVECYVDDADGAGEGTARVLPMMKANYEEKAGGVLKPKVAGEDARRVKDEDSEFQKWLVSHEDNKTALCIHFFVREGAYSAFRAARRIAQDKDWEVRWDPLLAGQGLTFGKPTPK